MAPIEGRRSAIGGPRRRRGSHVLPDEREVSRIYGSVVGATSRVRRPLRYSLSHLKDLLQSFEQADGLVVVIDQPYLKP